MISGGKFNHFARFRAKYSHIFFDTQTCTHRSKVKGESINYDNSEFQGNNLKPKSLKASREDIRSRFLRIGSCQFFYNVSCRWKGYTVIDRLKH